MKENKNSNVVNLNEYKERIKEFKIAANTDSDFKTYIKLLSINDLINESNHINQQIIKLPLSKNLSNKTQSIMDEVNCRLKKEDDRFSLTLIKIKRNIENKLAELQKFL